MKYYLRDNLPLTLINKAAILTFKFSFISYL